MIILRSTCKIECLFEVLSDIYASQVRPRTLQVEEQADILGSQDLISKNGSDDLSNRFQRSSVTLAHVG